MMHSTQALYDTLRQTAVQIERQIEAVTQSYMNSFPVHEKPNPEGVYNLKNTDGSFVMVPLLTAKAECLAGMTRLKTSQTETTNPRRPGRTW